MKFIDQLKQIRKAEWISIEKRLPDKNVTILALDNRKKVRVTRYTDRFSFHWGIKQEGIPEDFCNARYSHWMPLPEGPQE